MKSTPMPQRHRNPNSLIIHPVLSHCSSPPNEGLYPLQKAPISHHLKPSPLTNLPGFSPGPGLQFKEA